MSDLDFASIPLGQPLPYVQDGYRLFAGEVLNALILRINSGGSVTYPIQINQGGTGGDDAAEARVNLGVAIGVNVQAYSAFLTTMGALAGNGLVVKSGSSALTRSLVAPAAGMTIADPAGIAGNPTFAFTGNLLALVGLAGTGIAVQTGAGTWAQRTITGGTGLTITNGDGVAGNPTAAINLAASLTWTGIPNFSNGVMVSDDGVAIGAGGPTDALIYQPAVDQLAIAVGASTFTFTAASLSLNGNAFLTSATALLKASNLADLASATTALTNLGLSADAKSFVTAANYAAMRAAISLVPGVNVQTYSAGLATIAGLAPTNGDFLQYAAGAWANRTPTQATATLISFVGDSGAGGTKGLVPAPAAGDAAALKFLKADGTWASPSGSGDVVGPAASTASAVATFNGVTGKLLQDSKVILTTPAVAATLTLGSGKTITISNTLTFTGTDGSTLAIGAGGTLTPLAFTAPGTGVATALAINVGSVGAFVTFNGALGTPSSGALTNCTGLPVAAIVSSTVTPLGVGTLELGAAADTTLSRSAAGVLAVEGVEVPTVSSTNTLSNKRITPRVTSIVSSATPAINTDNCDAVTITALATAITSMTSSLTGTPLNFDKLTIRIKDDGTARAITWGTSFAAMGVALPTTTVISKVLTVGFLYDAVTAKWGCVASAQEV